jgi:hypothetical protein
VRCFAVLLLAVLACWWILTSCIVSDFWDPQYVMKLQSLKKCVAEMPGHPLWIVVGSSHVDHGLCPRVLAGDMKGEHAPLIFNFGLSGADLFREYICLRRLVRDGIKPDRFGVEVSAAILANNDTLFTEEGELVVRARYNELPDFRKFSPVPGDVSSWWYQSRIFPSLKYGTQAPLQSLFLKFPGLRFQHGLGKMPPYDQWGWFVAEPAVAVAPEVQAVLNENARQPFEASLKGKFHVAPLQSGMVERILAFCEKEGIKVFVLRMPESRFFQQIYSPEEKVAIDSFINDAAAKHGAPVIDAQSWMDDSMFSDGHHLNMDGAETFTRKLAVELEKAEVQR